MTPSDDDARRTLASLFNKVKETGRMQGQTLEERQENERREHEARQARKAKALPGGRGVSEGAPPHRRKSVKTAQMTVRLEPGIRDTIWQMAADRNLSAGDIIGEAVRLLAARKGVE